MSEKPFEVIDYYADGAWYDAEYVHIRADIDHYAKVAAGVTGTILELACGTGRISIPMAKAGATVVGIDSASGMIAEAERKRVKLPPDEAARVSFRVGDMRSVRLGRKFDCVVLAFNTLMHMLDDADLFRALATAREHLAEGGLFHLDLHTPFPSTGERDPDERYDPQEMIEPCSGRRFIVTENNHYDPRSQINTMRIYYQGVSRDGRPVGLEKRAEFRLRVIFPRELDLVLRLAGFEIVADWDDFECNRPFTGRGGRRVLAVRPVDL